MINNFNVTYQIDFKIYVVFMQVQTSLHKFCHVPPFLLDCNIILRVSHHLTQSLRHSQSMS